MFRRFTMVASLLWATLHGPISLAGPNDVKPSPILNLNAGISFELIDDIKAGKVPVDAMFTVFTEEDQKHLPVRIDLKFTPLCAAAHGNRLKAVTELLALGASVTVVARDCERKVSSEAALSEVALAYWSRTRSRPLAGTTTWLRVVPALPVKLKGVMVMVC